MKIHNGMFLTLEGTEGCGKSSQASMLYSSLVDQGYDVVKTREPGGTDMAEDIRGILFKEYSTPLTAKTEYLLFAAAREQHLAEVIQPALDEGKIVICDRYVDSSFAYQGVSRRLGIKMLEDSIKAFGTRMPDCTFWIDVPMEEALERARARGDANRFEAEELAFHESVYGAFQMLHSIHQRIKRIDGSGGREEVHERIVKSLPWRLCLAA